MTVQVSPIPKAHWSEICKDCSGSIDSLVELLQGRLSKAVMERVCQQKTGLFPAPSEIKLSCSCPDWADMCKHVAAVLYGIGARLDEQPELAFTLRAVDHAELIVSAAKGRTLSTKTPASAKVLDGDDLSALFGLEFEDVKPRPNSKTSDKDLKRPSAKKKSAESNRSSAKKTPVRKPLTVAVVAPKVRPPARALPESRSELPTVPTRHEPMRGLNLSAKKGRT